MKKTWMLTLGLLVSLLLGAENVELTFMDRDLDWPLEGVLVQIIGQEGSFYSDMDGKLEVPMPQ
ncbi:MAG: hypothetical protein PF447_10785, partial [Spirochaetaceae bacterium]|nr:hypothetical protein [Spirochaetaceae bacterium]